MGDERADIALVGEPAWKRRFRAPRVSVPDWARDEPERLLYASNETGKWELYAWDRRTGSPRQVTDRPEGTISGAIEPSGARIWWFDDKAGDERGVWMVQPFGGGSDIPAAAELPASYQAGLALAHDYAVVGCSNDAGSRIYLVRTGQTPTLLYSHAEMAEVSSVSRDEQLICLTHSEHGNSRHPALRVVDLTGATVGELWDGPGHGLMPVGWSPVAGDQRVLAGHDREAMARPLIWSPTTGAIQEIHVDLPGEVEAAWYPDASALLLTHAFQGRSELYRYDLAGGQLTRIPTAPGSVSDARIRPDGEVWYGWSDAATPPEVRADGRVLLRPRGELAPGGVPYVSHAIGELQFFVAEPPTPRPHPTFFWIHGGPHHHDSDAFAPFVQAWVDHGFAVVLVNYRGSTGSTRAWRDAIEGKPGFTELEDIARVHDWVVAEGIANPNAIVLAGGSWGGYLTLLGIGTQPERWTLGIGIVPVADYVAAYEDEMEPLKAFDRALFGGTPEDVPDEYRLRSPLTYIEQVRVPLLILAGENDPRCPIRQIDNYLARLRELGKPHEVYRYQAGHGSLVAEERLRHCEVALDFAKRQLAVAIGRQPL
jgi:acetyl esterase/lipase